MWTNFKVLSCWWTADGDDSVADFVFSCLKPQGPPATFIIRCITPGGKKRDLKITRHRERKIRVNWVD